MTGLADAVDIKTLKIILVHKKCFNDNENSVNAEHAGDFNDEH